MALSKQKLTAAKKRYQSHAGKDAAELTTIISATEPALSSEDVAQIVDALNGPAAPPAAGAENAGSGETSQDPPAPRESKNKIYDEYRVDPKYKEHPANPRAGTKPWRELIGFEKITKVKETRIIEERAELLNSQSENTRIRYYETGTDKSPGKIQ
jgi:hypothetical protein